MKHGKTRGRGKEEGSGRAGADSMAASKTTLASLPLRAVEMAVASSDEEIGGARKWAEQCRSVVVGGTTHVFCSAARTDSSVSAARRHHSLP